MRPNKKTVLRISFALAVLVFAALVYGELRYGLVRAGAPAPHAIFVTDATRARIVIRPLMARNLFDAWFPSDRKPPTWLLTRVLPHEVAFVISPELGTRRADVSLYINEQRLGPIVAKTVNQSGFMGQRDYLRWTRGGMEMEHRGSVVAHGTFTIQDRVAETARRNWGVVQGLDPLGIDGNHFFEAVFDNRDGGAFALMCALYDYGLLGEPQAPLEDEFATFLPIASIHVTADPTASGEVQLIVTLKSTPSAREEDVDANAFNLDIAIGEIGRVLRESYGAELRGRPFTEGATVTGRYTVKNVAGIISTLLAAR